MVIDPSTGKPYKRGFRVGEFIIILVLVSFFIWAGSLAKDRETLPSDPEFAATDRAAHVVTVLLISLVLYWIHHAWESARARKRLRQDAAYMAAVTAPRPQDVTGAIGAKDAVPPPAVDRSPAEAVALDALTQPPEEHPPLL